MQKIVEAVEMINLASKQDKFFHIIDVYPDRMVCSCSPYGVPEATKITGSQAYYYAWRHKKAAASIKEKSIIQDHRKDSNANATTGL